MRPDASAPPPGKPMGDAGVTMQQPAPGCRFQPAPAHPGADPWPVKHLVRDRVHAGGERYPFRRQLEIGRDDGTRTPAPGQLLVPDPGVSFRHCLLTQTAEGACFVRDVSRNGTRLDGRRLVPNVEAEFHVGQVLEIGHGFHFVLEGEEAAADAAAATRGGTELSPQLTLATVLVGDIRDYTVLVREAPAAALQQSVSRVFEALTAAVGGHGGTVKEFPGDAILAFWEGDFRGMMALTACRAAIALDRTVRQLAGDPAIWSVPGAALRMDWALATGQVVIDSFGGATTLGLSMVGEPVVLAFRLEKFATDDTGPILACPVTRDLVGRALRAAPPDGPPPDFADLGTMHAEGFEAPDHVFALRSPDG